MLLPLDTIYILSAQPVPKCQPQGTSTDIYNLLNKFYWDEKDIAGIVSIVITVCGFFVLKLINRKGNESPLSPFVVQILGMCFILPVLLTMALTLKLDKEAVTSILGTIVGYVFGSTAKTSPSQLVEFHNKAEETHPPDKIE